MAKSPLILAALANDAVPNIDFIDVKSLSTNSIGAFDSAILTSVDNDHAVIRIARNAAAGAEQDVELRALAALESQRTSLPFKVTKVLGVTADQRGARAIVFDFVYGNSIDVPSLAPEGHLAESIGKAIAAIHNLPAAVVQEAHLAEYQPAETVRARVADLDRAAATGRLPAVLLARWENALEDSELFRYRPTVIHGSLSGETVLELDQEVSGILNWAGLKIGDPAEDFAWIFGAAVPELTDTVLMAYSIGRSMSDPTIRQRAALYSELEMARWLLHGVSQNEAEVVEDALAMLNGLVEELAAGTLRPLTATAPAAVVAESAFVSMSDVPGDSAFVADEAGAVAEETAGVNNEAGLVTEEISIVTEEITIVTEEISIVTDEVTIVDDAGLEGQPVSDADNTKTRVIELPEKGDNELF
jgi:hypothetical protein